MKEYNKTFEVKWADMDPNRHMRHTVYNDYAAQARVGMFTDYGLPLESIAKTGLGPILFREETHFLKEVHLLDRITVYCKVKAMRKDGTKWSYFHEIFKEDDIKVAEITVDGAWLNLKTRKIGTPSKEMMEIINQFPRTEDFTWLPDRHT